MRDEIWSKKWTVTADASGEVVVSNIFGSTVSKINGYIEQINIRASSGGGANVSIEIRGDQTSSNIEDLFYSNTSATLPVTDSAINAPFDTRGTEDGDLSLYLNPASTGTFEVRIDFRILGKNS